MSGSYARIHLGRASLVAASLLGTAVNNYAGDYNAQHIMQDLTVPQQKAYITGVIEGLAYARYKKDGNKTEGMKCIYDWLYEDKSAMDRVYVAFGDFPTYTPAAILAALVQKKCGD